MSLIKKLQMLLENVDGEIECVNENVCMYVVELL